MSKFEFAQIDPTEHPLGRFNALHQGNVISKILDWIIYTSDRDYMDKTVRFQKAELSGRTSLRARLERVRFLFNNRNCLNFPDDHTHDRCGKCYLRDSLR